jgi:hypothetical protein
MALDIPATMDDITPEWLTAALREGGVLKTSNVLRAPRVVIGTGLGILGEIARITPEYDKPEVEAPATVVAKIPTADPGGRGIAQMLGFYEKEVRFYRELANRVSAPRGYYANGDPAAVRYVILMEDLGNHRLGDQVAGASASDAELVVRQLAKQHAAWWDSVQLRALDWIPMANAPQILFVQGAYMLAVEPFLKSFGEALTDRQHQLVQSLAMRINSLQNSFATRTPTLCHGDVRLDNIFFGRWDGHRPLTFVDWQIALKAPGPYDVAYFLSQSVEPAAREATEQMLLKHYHQALLDGGVTGYTWEQCWDDYRVTTLFCVAYPVIAGGQIDLGNERGVDLVRKMALRSLNAAVDLEVDDLLERFEERPPFTG